MSIQPRKQRKALYTNPFHRRHRRLASSLAEPLMLKYETRSLPLVKGDTVKVTRGDFRGHVGKIIGVNLRTMKVTVDGITIATAKGVQKPKPIDPSNLVITKLLLTDKLRREKLGASEADVEKEAPAKEEKADEKPVEGEAGSKRADREEEAGDGTEEDLAEKVMEKEEAKK